MKGVDGIIFQIFHLYNALNIANKKSRIIATTKENLILFFFFFAVTKPNK